YASFSYVLPKVNTKTPTTFFSTSFTGLRIGVSVAKGLCYGLNIPLISVCSLEMMAVHTARNLEKYVSREKFFAISFLPDD
ncbi:MAG: hypothetical protein MZV63_15815, partial [Marinilabiliales bacterium]|nr:hypothetical protein [Marinilabiliales bacterium]